MRVVIQRVLTSKVEIDGRTVAQIGRGLNLLLGLGKNDDLKTIEQGANKILALRILSDTKGKMNLSVKDTQSEILVIFQFTLYGSLEKGNRPGFDQAAPPDQAKALYEHFIKTLKQSGLRVETGEFGADMRVHIENDGPVTFVLEK